MKDKSGDVQEGPALKTAGAEGEITAGSLRNSFFYCFLKLYLHFGSLLDGYIIEPSLFYCS